VFAHELYVRAAGPAGDTRGRESREKTCANPIHGCHDALCFESSIASVGIHAAAQGDPLGWPRSSAIVRHRARHDGGLTGSKGNREPIPLTFDARKRMILPNPGEPHPRFHAPGIEPRSGGNQPQLPPAS